MYLCIRFFKKFIVFYLSGTHNNIGFSRGAEKYIGKSGLWKIARERGAQLFVLFYFCHLGPENLG